MGRPSAQIARGVGLASIAALLFGVTAPFLKLASDPPVIVDKRGRYYGRLTVNEYRDQTRLGWAIAWLAAVCKH